MTHDQPTPTPTPVLTPIPMGTAADGRPVVFEPHSTLCAQFAERTAAYLREVEGLKRSMIALRAAIPPATQVAQVAQVADLTRRRCERLIERVTTVRAETNAWFLASALACPACSATLSTQPWPLPGTEDMLSEVLRREVRERRAAHD